MKLRIQGSSLRLRLKQGEVAAFAADGRVVDRIVFGTGDVLVYGLEAAEIDAVAVRRAAGEVVVRVPRALADDWTGSERVGFGAELDTGATEPLKVLVEKDFACLHRRPGEDESDAYPNPAAD